MSKRNYTEVLASILNDVRQRATVYKLPTGLKHSYGGKYKKKCTEKHCPLARITIVY